MTEAASTESPSDTLERARQLIADEQYEQAKVLLESAIQTDSTAEIAHELAMTHYYLADKQTALQYLNVAVKTDPTHIISFVKAADILQEEDLNEMAMSCYASAIAANPENNLLKEKFIHIASWYRFSGPAPHFRALYVQCLDTPGIDFSHMGASWFSLLQQDPEFKAHYKNLNQKKYRVFKKNFLQLTDHQFLIQPLFRLALKNQVRVASMEFENFIKHLRHVLLDLLEEQSRLIKDDDFIALAEAVAFYCFHTEYIFSTTDEERQKVAALRIAEPAEETIAVLGCYMPLHEPDHAAAIENRLASSAIGDLIQSQITEQREQHEIKKTIPSITETRDSVSLKVQEQYEESPYPRWVSYAKSMYDESIEGHLSGAKAQILVAGCGTGHEAIELAHVFPDATVLAVDLSYASLAYGIKMARQYGIHNIQFKQADILELGTLDQTFDYVTCSGVLHHLEDPKAGWKVVTSLLRPGGIMRLSLYSKTARRAVLKAQEIIKKKGFNATAEDIRRFRDKAPKLLRKKDYQAISGYLDYYSLSECRDMLFHVQEHDFELPEIKQWLEEAALEFLGFHISKKVKKRYIAAFPQDPAAVNLDLWAQYEVENPDTFISMYRFWLRKK